MKSEPITIRLSGQAQDKLDQMLEQEPWLNRSSAIEKMILSYQEDTMKARDFRYCKICGSEYDALDPAQYGQHGDGCWKCDPRPDMMEYAESACQEIYQEKHHTK